MHVRTSSLPAAATVASWNVRDERRPRPRRRTAPAVTAEDRVPTDIADAAREERARAMQALSPGHTASARCAAIGRLVELDWPVHQRRGLLMSLLHAALDPSPPVRFAALDALVRASTRFPRLRPHAVAVLERWARGACRATALHAARLLDGLPSRPEAAAGER